MPLKVVNIEARGITIVGLPKNYADLKKKKLHIGLCMIVKNEAHIIEQTLYNLLPYIDGWCICDTGSTDGTQELITSFFSKYEIPGVLFQRKWVNFAHNRTEALEYCRDIAEYAFVMDADDIIQGLPKLPQRRYVPPPHKKDTPVTEDELKEWREKVSKFPKRLVDKAYQLRIGPGTIYWRTQIMNLKYEWRYVGVLHEVVICDRVRANSHNKLDGDYLLLSRRLGSRSKDKDKYKKDAATLQTEVDRRQPLLIKDIAQATKKESVIQLKSNEELQFKWAGLKLLHPKLGKLYESYERDCFYLAQSYFDAKEFEQAMRWYSIRIHFGGWEEEVYHSLYRQLCCARELGMSSKDMFSKYFCVVHKQFPYRSEPILVMARKYVSDASSPSLNSSEAKKSLEMAATLLQKALYRTIPYELLLFVEQHCYRWEVPFEYVRICVQLERYEDALRAIYWLLMTNPFYHSFNDGSDTVTEEKLLDGIRSYEAVCNTALSLDSKRSIEIWDEIFIKHIQPMYEWKPFVENTSNPPKFVPSSPNLQLDNPMLFWKEVETFQKMWERRIATVKDIIPRLEEKPLQAHPQKRVSQKEMDRYQSKRLKSQQERNAYEQQEKVEKLMEDKQYDQVVQLLLPRYRTMMTKSENVDPNQTWELIFDLVHAVLANELAAKEMDVAKLVATTHPRSPPPFPLQTIQLSRPLSSVNHQIPETIAAELRKLQPHLTGHSLQEYNEKECDKMNVKELIDCVEFLMQRYVYKCDLPTMSHTRLPFDVNELSDLARCQLDTELVDRVWNFYLQALSLVRYQNVYYDWKRIDDLTKHLKEASSTTPHETQQKRRVIWTMTTCKRLDLFVPTMLSFINSCQDLYEIDRFVVIDDNSDEKDRLVMSTLFPFVDFIWKSPAEKGHARSMNMLRNLVLKEKFDYWLHMEDDFMFFKRRSFVVEPMRIMHEQGSVGQVLFNRHYGESPRIEHDKSVGQDVVEYLSSSSSSPEQLQSKTEFIRHIHWNYSTEHGSYFAYTRLFPMIRHQNGSCHCYWDGYSLRPSLIRVEMIKRCGAYKEEPSFERSYAMQAFSNGWQSAFLNDFCCEHVGRLTSERFDNSIANAYVLNQQDQWSSA